MTIIVSAATPDHIPAMAELLEEMDRFYGGEPQDPADVRAGQIRQALFADPPAAYALLAWVNDRLAGIASYSFLWPAVGLTRSLYLKELYVAKSAQRQGAGTALMRALAKVATAHKCSRVEWTADADNDGARRFYERLGQEGLATKVFYRADIDAIGRLAGGGG
ncbi:GNAT family N-acetyltransferase [Spongiactinospora rosea]|uniref:GNAT family N-acetyltransferase n=1 Tax=Spongiactinospora rosea TaxID=2248750 RepID=A0A366LSP2_9ACTN|nr:GNAT family N-acetyltransferase [Spongiactinospora rosea]RBQ16956.1 GNAT family N-acetyltransferase [Spongiactinospora rosea]